MKLFLLIKQLINEYESTTIIPIDFSDFEHKLFEIIINFLRKK